MEYKKLTNTKSDFPFVIGAVTICFALTFTTAVYGLLKINKLENDLQELKNKYGKLQENYMKPSENGNILGFNDDSNFEYQLDDVSFQSVYKLVDNSKPEIVNTKMLGRCLKFMHTLYKQDYEDYENGDYNQTGFIDDDNTSESDDTTEVKNPDVSKNLPISIKDDDESNEQTSEGSGTQVLFSGGYFTKVGLEEKRQKRDVVATTIDGVPVNSESYADAKNKSEGKGVLKLYPRLMRKGTSLPQGYTSSPRNEDRLVGLKHYDSLTNRRSTAAPGPVLARRSRVMHVEDKSKAFRRVVKKPMVKSADRTYQEHSASPEVIIRDVHHRRRHRQRRVESFNEPTYIRMKPMIHLNGEISQSAHQGIYENFDGNGRLHHYDRHFANWTTDEWVQNLNLDQYFEYSDGYLTILETGVYLIYAQIFYVDQHDTNGFGVYLNKKLILQCTTTSHTSHRIEKPNTCYTAGVQYVTEGDQIKVQDFEADRYSIFESGKSFFGAVKLGDARIK